MQKHTRASIAKHFQHGLATIADDMAEMRDDLSQMRSGMLTKTDHHALHQQMLDEFKSVQLELRDICSRLDRLAELYQDLKGVTKEIDDIRNRVRQIERHLGIDKMIAA